MMAKAYRAGLALGLLAAVTGCEDDGAIAVLEARIEVDPPEVQFGQVQVGTTQQQQVVVTNTGNGLLDFSLVEGNPFPADGVFAYDVEQTALPAGANSVVTVVFSPTAVGRVEGVIEIRTNVPGTPTVELRLVGEGVTTTLAVDPQRMDFGNVVVQTTRTLPLVLTNNSDVNANIEYRGGTNVRRCEDRNDPGDFCIRFRDRTFGADGSFPLASREQAEIEVLFTPPTAGMRYEGNFVLRGCDSSACEVRVTLTGLGVESGLRCQPAALDFGQVNPGSSANLTVTCENIANDPVSLNAATFGGGDSSAFEVFSFRPQTLNERDTAAIEVVYAPVNLGDVSTTLRIETDNSNPALRVVEIPVRGSGGGPDVQVIPAQLNFGRVATIAPSRRNLTITNVGNAPLEITGIEVDTAGTGSFTSPDANPTVIAPGGTETVTITFEPREEGQIVSAVRILSNDADEPSLDVVVRGEGVNVPPCNYEVVPSQLDFGAVATTRNLRRSFEIRNRGSDICIITAVRLLPGSDPAFSLPGGDIMSRDIPAGAAEVVTVEFAPQSAGTFTGRVEFSISNPSTPFNEVPLNGVGADSTLLIVPGELDFGVIGVGCASRDRPVTVYNTGSTAAQVERIGLASGSNVAFRLSNIPAPLPGSAVSIAPGSSTQFDVGFRADVASAFAGAVELDVIIDGNDQRSIIPLNGRGAVDAVQVDEFEQLGKPEVDILFVVDDSCSMDPYQTALGQNFRDFVQFAEAQGLDYHMGVTTTDTTNRVGGRLLPIDGAAQNRIVTPRSVPSPDTVFQQNAVAGISGSATERGFEGAYLALTPPHVFGHNAGFLRAEAVLSIVFVSDEPEQSTNTVDFYANFFRSIKGFRNTNLFSASSIAPPDPNPGNCGFGSGIRYLEMARRTGGVEDEICTPDWSTTLEALAETAFGFKSRFFLNNQPVPQSMRVFVDGVELPGQSVQGTINWTYERGSNALNFAPYATPEPGSQIRVEYQAECL